MSRRRRKKHEEHSSHEAWAIPYGDLVTLLLAFFVVMYAISSVNDGKYRLLSDSLNAAFRGTPSTMAPVQVGEKQVGSGADIRMSIVQQVTLQGQPRSLLNPPNPVLAGVDERTRQLREMAEEVEQAMGPLIDSGLVAVRRHDDFIEVEIKTDILFRSGVATVSTGASPVLAQLAGTLRPFTNPIRVEGYTDDRPIRTAAFPSNWELSAARAASVVHLLTDNGINPARLAVVAYGEHRPLRPNDSPEARNANRRVVLVILSSDPPASPKPVESPPVASAAEP
jgi:chemotaxis protein MotB